MKKLLLFFLLLSSRAFAGWTTQEIVLQGTVLGLFATDAIQSYQMGKKSIQLQDGKTLTFVELNPILGKHPKPWQIGIYWTSCGILHTGVSILLKKKIPSMLPVWQSVWIGVEGHAVYKNYRLSVSTKF